MTAVTISGGTSVFSSVTKLLPMVWRVLVSQFGEPSATGPISRATSPRATPTTRARSTWAAKGTRRRRASTKGAPVLREGWDEERRRASTARGRRPPVVERAAARQAPEVLHGGVNAD